MHISSTLPACPRPACLTISIASKNRRAHDILDIRRWDDRSQPKFSRPVGGCSLVGDAVGLWYAEEQGISTEKTTAIITLYVSLDDAVAHLDTLRIVITHICFRTDRDARAVDVDLIFGL